MIIDRQFNSSLLPLLMFILLLSFLGCCFASFFPPNNISINKTFSLCTRFKSNEVQMQGLFATYTHLYLVENEHLYTIPLNDHYIDWQRKKIALFDRGNGTNIEDRFTSLGHWLDIEWIKAIMNETKITNWSSLILHRLVIKENRDVSNKELRVVDIYFSRNASTNIEKISGFNMTTHGKLVTLGSNDHLESLISEARDGQRYLLFKYDATNQIEIKLSIPDKYNNIEKINLDLPATGSNWLNISTSQLTTPKTALITKLPIFGFIYEQKKVQLWDVHQGKVFAFELTNFRTSIMLPLEQIPLNEFFVCSEEDWKRLRMSESSTETPSTENSTEEFINHTIGFTKEKPFVRSTPVLPESSNFDATSKNSSFLITIVILGVVLLFAVCIPVVVILRKRIVRHKEKSRINFGSGPALNREPNFSKATPKSIELSLFVKNNANAAQVIDSSSVPVEIHDSPSLVADRESD